MTTDGPSQQPTAAGWLGSMWLYNESGARMEPI